MFYSEVNLKRNLNLKQKNIIVKHNYSSNQMYLLSSPYIEFV